MAAYVETWSGVSQPARISNGMRNIAVEAAKLPGVKAVYHRWFYPISLSVAAINEWLADFPDGAVVLAGHSRGGRTACDVAAALGDPCKLVLADPWDSSGVVTVPANVTHVYSFIKREGRPQTAKIQWTSVATRHTSVAVDVGHIAVDDLEAVAKCVMALARTNAE